MFQLVSCLHRPVKCKSSCLFAARRIFSEVVACRSTSPRISTNSLSLSSRCRSSPTHDDSDELSPLDPDQLAQLFSGRFPTDFSGEVAYVRTSRNGFHRLVDAFDRTSNERKRTISLSFNEQISTTAVHLKQTALHVSMINYISDQVKRDMPSEEIVPAANYRLAKGLSEPDFQLRYQKNGHLTNTPLIAFEVGFSQPSDELEQKVKALLNKTSTKVVVMFDFTESPKYKNPFIRGVTGDTTKGQTSKKGKKGKIDKADTTDKTGQLNWTNIEIFRSQRQQADVESSIYTKDSRNPYGPLSVYGLQWVGEMTGLVQVYVKDTESGKAVAKTRRMLVYGRQEMSDRQWKERLQRQAMRLEKEREEREKRELNAVAEGVVHDTENEIDNWTVQEKDRPIYAACPKLDVTLADFLPFNDLTYQKELAFDWDRLRSRVDKCKGSLAIDRIEDAIGFLEKKGVQV